MTFNIEKLYYTLYSYQYQKNTMPSTPRNFTSSAVSLAHLANSSLYWERIGLLIFITEGFLILGSIRTFTIIQQVHITCLNSNPKEKFLSKQLNNIYIFLMP